MTSQFELKKKEKYSKKTDILKETFQSISSLREAREIFHTV